MNYRRVSTAYLAAILRIKATTFETIVSQFKATEELRRRDAVRML